MANISQNQNTPSTAAVSFFSNPFNAKNDAVTDAAAQHENGKLAARANAIFADKPFNLEYKGVFILSQILAFSGAAVTFFASLFAFQFLLAHTVGAFSWVAAAAVCAIVELLKLLLWKSTVKNKMRYKNSAVGGILALSVLHLFSLAAACLGAYLLPAHSSQNAPVDVPNTAAAVITSAANVDAQIAETDKQITAYLPLLIAPNGKKSGSTANQIAALRAQKDALLSQKKELAETIAAAQLADKELAEKAESEKGADNFTMQLLCVIVAVVFELIYIACTLFIFYYLFRAFVDYAAPAPAAVAQQTAQAAQGTPVAQLIPHAPPVAQLPESQPRKIGFYTEENSCTTVAQPSKGEKTPYKGQITAQTPFAITESNGVPVASILGKLYTVDRVRSNYTANKSKSKGADLYAEKAIFWERVLTELQQVG